MIDKMYIDLLDKLIREGTELQTRNSICKRLFAINLVITKTPLISIRKTSWKNALREWEWFMSGSTNINHLHPDVRHWWQPWAEESGNVYYNYSKQFRDFGGTYRNTDQMALFIEGIKDHPNSRRNVITTWNAADMVDSMCKITNCHNTVTQAFVEPDNKLHLVTYQRSVDVVCGLPHNLIQMWGFLLWLANTTDKKVGTLTWIGGDVHLYKVHEELTKKMIENLYKCQEIPELVYLPKPLGFHADDFRLSNVYVPILLDKAEMVI